MGMFFNMVQKALSLGASMSLLQLLAIGSASGLLLETPLDSKFSFATRIEGRQYCLSANNARPGDTRDVNSVYVNVRRNCDGRITFTGEPVWTTNGPGVILQATTVPTALGPTGTNWYFAVHDYYEGDRFPESPEAVRVILHRDRAKAAVWGVNKLVNFPFQSALDVVDNLDVTWDSELEAMSPWLLALGNRRSKESFYLTVSSDVAAALSVDVDVEEFGTPPPLQLPPVTTLPA